MCLAFGSTIFKTMVARLLEGYGVYAGSLLCGLLALILFSYRFLRVRDQGYRRPIAWLLCVGQAGVFFFFFFALLRAVNYEMDAWSYIFALALTIIPAFITRELTRLFPARDRPRRGPVPGELF